MTVEIAMRREGSHLVARDEVAAIQRRIEASSIPEPNSGCWIWLGSLSKGYGYIRLKGKMRIASRISYMVFKCDPGPFQVCHICDFPPCVNPDHLFLGTPSDNSMDAARKGRIKNQKILPSERQAIISSPLPGWKLAENYGVCDATISLIRNERLLWRHRK